MSCLISRRRLLAGAAAMLPLRAEKLSGHMGLEMYTLRAAAEKDLPGTLDLIRKLGFTDLEVGSLFGRSAAEFRRMLDRAGLRVSSLMADYARLTKEIATVQDEAHTLGVEYVVCSTLPHSKVFTMEECKRGAEAFNRWADSVVRSGLGFGYHTHGFEFRPSPDGTLFDTLLKSTDPKVQFEMDIFWIVFGNQDPATLLSRYPGRFPLMHVKDMRKDTVRNFRPGDVTEDASVPLGTGAVDIPAALRAAQKAGVRHYYLEDEAVDAIRQIPQSLKYVESLKL
jgi:sugar phosphate isomerase/epimerase